MGRIMKVGQNNRKMKHRERSEVHDVPVFDIDQVETFGKVTPLQFNHLC